ncbi:OLC1v1013662C1 [Oldenlandia corymbosa var. corymbosa]|uniref:OLC1v1013662C1 n=1 Tax=Oldenlandia corymbosa var. corymbosa TaxID=529605 RepID=A0AAV1DZ17_OLDCO|nr:OLC1v1013662C1 [Oldenlandia corymbosa var. corymbosa]
MLLVIRLTILLIILLKVINKLPHEDHDDVNSHSISSLQTNSRWIVNESGKRVKLACVNWAAHLETAVAEGLSKQPVDVISKTILDLGFNCVRLTWPLSLITNYNSLGISDQFTVRDSFLKAGLSPYIAGIQVNNPSILDLSLINAFQAVVTSLSNHKVMIILDNHTSKPGWCCGGSDGDGFFGDQYFNPDLWIKGLTTMATMFKDDKYLIGISLRNELRGPKENVDDWYRYMKKGAEAVHAVNPDLLIILSGLHYDRDLSFLFQKPLKLKFKSKLVYEVHWYSFSDGHSWATGNPNQVCGQTVDNMNRKSGFLLDQGYPLFVSEFGLDLRGGNWSHNRYFNCFMSWAAERDFDWAIWTVVGSYYVRKGVVGLNETYGIFNWNWSEVSNPSLLKRISVLQTPFQEPGVSPHKIIFHPLTGLCIQRQSNLNQLKLGPCSEAEVWDYSPDQKVLSINGTDRCIEAAKLGEPVKLGIVCNQKSSKWEPISESKMHLSSNPLQDVNYQICLDVNSNNVVISSTCKCLSKDNTCDPASQWFKIIDSS